MDVDVKVLRGLLERAALPECEATNNGGVSEWRVRQATLPPWTVAELWCSPAASTDAVEARAQLFAALPAALPELLDAFERAEATLDNAGRQILNIGAARNAATERAERAEERVAKLEEIIAGRTTPPTDAEIDAHAARDGIWLYNYRGKNLSVVARVNTLRIEAEGCRTGQITGSRWWPLDADGRPCAWPTAEVSRG